MMPGDAAVMNAVSRAGIGKRTLKTPDIGLDRFGAAEGHRADARGRRDLKLDGAGKSREVGEVG